MAKTISSELDRLIQTKLEIKNAIESKGVTVGLIPFEEYSLKILDIEGSGSGTDPGEPPVDPGDFLPVGSLYSGSYSAGEKISLNSTDTITIEGKMFSGLSTETDAPFISLESCTNVVIQNCYFKNLFENPAIYLGSCSNVTIRNCSFENCYSAVFVYNSSGNIKIEYNEALNITGHLITDGQKSFPTLYDRGQFVLINTMGGVGNSISFNSIENEAGLSYMDDGISGHYMTGTSGSPILINRNWIRGGAPISDSTGISVGAYGAEYNTVSENVIYGSMGIGLYIYGGNNILISENTIYSLPSRAANFGIYAYNHTPEVTPGNISALDNHSVWWKLESNGSLSNNWGYMDASIASYLSNLETNTTDVNDEGDYLPAIVTNRILKKDYGFAISKTSMTPWATGHYMEIKMDSPHIDGTSFSPTDSNLKTTASVIKIPEGVTSLGNSSLGSTSSITSLVSIVLPSTLTTLGTNALRYNSSLNLLVVHSSTPPSVGTNSLSNLPAGLKIRVPYNSINSYKSADGWSTHADKIWSI